MLQPQKSPPSCVLERGGGTVNLALDQLDQRHDMEVEGLASRVPKEVRAETVQCISVSIRIQIRQNDNVSESVRMSIRMSIRMCQDASVWPKKLRPTAQVEVATIVDNELTPDVGDTGDAGDAGDAANARDAEETTKGKPTRGALLSPDLSRGKTYQMLSYVIK